MFDLNLTYFTKYEAVLQVAQGVQEQLEANIIAQVSSHKYYCTNIIAQIVLHKYHCINVIAQGVQEQLVTIIIAGAFKSVIRFRIANLCFQYNSSRNHIEII